MSTTTKIIAEGKAATIVSPSQLAANVGGKAGVEVGDTMVVRRTIKVTDPDTKKSLGAVHLTRLRMRVTLVSDDFCVGTVNEEIPSSALAAIVDVTRVTKFKTIVNSEALANANSVFVEPGEPVIVTRQIEGNDGT